MTIPIPIELTISIEFCILELALLESASTNNFDFLDQIGRKMVFPVKNEKIGFARASMVVTTTLKFSALGPTDTTLF